MKNVGKKNNPYDLPYHKYWEILINQTEDFIWSIDTDYNLLAANTSFLRQLKNITGKQFKPGDCLIDSNNFPNETLSLYKNHYNKALSGISFTEEIYFVANNTNHCLEINFNPLYDGDQIVGSACFSRDITEKKIAELRLKEKEALLDEAQRLANIGSWNFDLTTGQLHWSDELYRVFETNTQTFNETVSAFFQFIIPEDRKRVWERSKLARDTGEPFTIEYQIITATGKRKFIQENGSAQKNEAGQVIRLFGTAQDVTVQVEAKQKIELAEKQLEVIYNTVSDIIFMISVEGVGKYKFVSVNNMFLTATNLHKDQVINKYVEEIIPSPSLEIVLEKYHEAITSRNTVAWEEESIYPSGKKYGSVTISPVIDDNGKCILLVGSVHDITEQKKSERKLIQSEEKYRLLFKHSPLPMWIYDFNTLQFLEVNSAAIEHYGYSKTEFESMTLDQIKLPQSKPELLHLSNEYYKETFLQYSMHKKKNGEIIQVQISISTIEYENKKARLVLLVDRTNQAAAEKALVETTKQLRELTSHLQSVREEERTNIAREIHDELGQQLTALKMELAWVKRKVVSEDEQTKIKINSSLQLVDATINTVRKIASELRPSIIDDLGINEAIDWQLNQFSTRTGIEVHFHSGIDDTSLNDGIPIAFFRIVQEALTNITRHAFATKVKCTLQQNGSSILLIITDNGVGFDINNTGENKTLGILGMKERATMLNGNFEIISKSGTGTQVVVTIPFLKV